MIAPVCHEGQPLVVGDVVEVVYAQSSFLHLKGRILGFDSDGAGGVVARLITLAHRPTTFSLYTWKLKRLDLDLELDEGL